MVLYGGYLFVWNTRSGEAMKTTIYTFTGTGNTLSVVQNLASALGQTVIAPIPGAGGDTDSSPDLTSADAIGIAFPVHFMDMPEIVREWVESLTISGNPYIFGIATCGGSAGGALYNLDMLLKAKGLHLSSGFVFTMPENFNGPINLMESLDEVEKRLASAGERIPEVAAVIREKQELPPEGSDSLPFRIAGPVVRFLLTELYPTKRRFHATEACNRCGLCSRICPTKNITITGSAVSWGSACTLCYACIHWCPEEAVEIGNRTKGKRRYTHPDVTVADMVAQRGG